METLEEVFGLIPEEEREAAQALISGLINNEKERGIEATQKKSKELHKANMRVKEAGYSAEEYESFEKFTEYLKEVKHKAETSDLTLAQVNEKLRESDAKLLAETTKASNEVIRSKLLKDIGSKIYGGEYLVENIITKGTLTIDGETITSADGDYDTFVTTTLEANKANLKSDQVPGSDLKQSTNETEANKVAADIRANTTRHFD